MLMNPADRPGPLRRPEPQAINITWLLSWPLFFEKIAKSVGGCLLWGFLLAGSGIMAQDDHSLEETKTILQALADQAKQLKSASEYSDFIDQCQPVLQRELTTAQRNYVTNVAAWARGKRGELRLETAEQLQQVGNAQFQQALESALEDFDRAIEAEQSRWKLFLLRGIARTQLNRWPEAAADFTRVVELRPEETNGWYNRGLVHKMQQQWEAAVLDFDTALNLQANDLEILTARGQAYLGWQQFDQSLLDFQRVLEKLPEHPAAKINLADALVGLRRWSDAMQLFQQVAAEGPESAESAESAQGAEGVDSERVAIAWQRLAWLQATCPDLQFRNLENALTSIRKALELAGETRGNLETLAVIQTIQGESDLARQTAQRAVELIGQSVISLIQTAELDQELMQQPHIRLMQYSESLNFSGDANPKEQDPGPQAGSER
jgi:tetratricopeptide (TPR) repeat protein